MWLVSQSEPSHCGPHMARLCPLGHCIKSAAIWGTLVVMTTRLPWQPTTISAVRRESFYICCLVDSDQSYPTKLRSRHGLYLNQQTLRV
jgi:hypothetical protein